ncbi:sensor histidine kinase [Candidatus Riflebacteria bacterium]
MEEKKWRILSVDDEPNNLQLLGQILKERYQLSFAINGTKALEVAAKVKPDLILLDIMMPDMSGFEVCQKLRENEDLKEIPVIFISAMTATEDKLKAFESGGVDYVTKPFQHPEVIARVDAQIRLRQARLEVAEKNQELEKTLIDLKNTQSQLVQSEKMASIGVLTAGVAHEINNPINFMSGSSKALKKLLPHLLGVLEAYCKIKPVADGKQEQIEEAYEKLKEIEELKEDLDFGEIVEGIKELTDNIQTGAERTAEIVKGLRTFSRLDEAEKKTADLHENINSTLILLKNQYKHVLEIEKDYGEIPPILCFPGKLNQVFMNILVNAIHAVQDKEVKAEQEKISIRTCLQKKDDGEVAEIRITDTGIGIPEDVKKNIFDPFFTTKAVGKGTGLGLAICQGIIEDHGGTICIDSSPGQGTTFIITVPVG